MYDFLISAWRFEYALIPCITAYVVFDAPILVRRITRKAYVPIYFAFFPAGFSDELLAKYFDEDDYWIVGGPYFEKERPKARMKIFAVSIISLAFTMALSPFVSAAFSFYFLSEGQFTQFLWTLAFVKAVLLLWAFYDLAYGFEMSVRIPAKILGPIYLVYWSLLIYFTSTGYTWIASADQVGGFSSVLSGLADYVVFEIGVGILFSTVLGAVVLWWLTEQRESNVE